MSLSCSSNVEPFINLIWFCSITQRLHRFFGDIIKLFDIDFPYRLSIILTVTVASTMPSALHIVLSRSLAILQSDIVPRVFSYIFLSLLHKCVYQSLFPSILFVGRVLFLIITRLIQLLSLKYLYLYLSTQRSLIFISLILYRFKCQYSKQLRCCFS